MLTSSTIYDHKVRLKRLKLESFRGFRHIDLSFHERLTILIADNGGGKTSILDGIAEFLKYFLAEGILPESIAGYESKLTGRDIKNDQLASLCEMDFELVYKYPAPEIFSLMNSIAEYLDRYQLAGENAVLNPLSSMHSNAADEVTGWILKVDQDLVPLPEDIVSELDRIKNGVIRKNPETKIEEFQDILGENPFIVACKLEDAWRPNLDLSILDISHSVLHSGVLSIQFELTKTGISFVVPHKKNTTDYDIFFKNLSSNAFIEDFRISAGRYSAHNSPVVLPLLVYFGGSAITTSSSDPKLRYKPRSFQAYKQSLEPDRFDFQSFIEWYFTLSEGPAHIHRQVEEAILSALNADEKIYSHIRIEQGELRLNKQSSLGEGVPVTITIDQLSAGERMVFALIADLTKRAIELNPTLFTIDYDPGIGTYENPLQSTYGIVLIDEIDLHLHPKWQRQIIPILLKTFPLVQFVVTTHSPFVLQSAKYDQRIRIRNNVPIYSQKNDVSDYETVVVDYFLISDFFDAETESILKKFRIYLYEVALQDRDKKDPEFIKLIKQLSEMGDTIKRIVAFELSQLN